MWFSIFYIKQVIEIDGIDNKWYYQLQLKLKQMNNDPQSHKLSIFDESHKLKHVITTSINIGFPC